MSKNSTGDSVSLPARDREFSDFYKKILPGLSRYADRMTGGWVTGDDIAQEALIEVYESWDRIPVEWRRGRAYKIAHYRVVSHIRRRASEQKAIGQLIVNNAFGGPDLIEIEEAIAELSVEQRAALLMDIIGLSRKEISYVMEVKEYKVRRILQKARQKLRRLLGYSDKRRPRGKGRNPMVGEASTGRSASS